MTKTNRPFLDGKPEDLVNYIENIEEKGFTNLKKENIEDLIVGHEIVSDSFKIIYLLSQKNENVVSFVFQDSFYFRILFDMSNYGFNDSKKISFRPNKTELDLNLSSLERYSSLLTRNEMSINNFLEDVGYIVNNSMAYDTKKAISDYSKDPEAGGIDKRRKIKKYYKKLTKAEYNPKGDETMKGTCIDSGRIIRNLLSSLNVKNDIYFVKASTRKDDVGHDVTIVFDSGSKEWALINSKSRSKLYNLVPKEGLVDFGSPFYK